MSETREARPLRMNAYYYSFEPTGVPAIDLILSAVACAGKAYHHTDGWTEPASAEPPFRGTTHAEWIQNAASDAAALFTPFKAQPEPPTPEREARLAQRRKRREEWIRAYLDGAEPERPAARCVWKITRGEILGTWVQPACQDGAIPAPWGTERAKACHLCGQPLVVEASHD